MAKAPLDIQIKAVDRFSGVFKKGERGLGRLSGATTRVANNFSLLKKRTEGFRNAMKKTNAVVGSAGKSMSVGITLPVAAMGADIIRTAANFEKSMNKVKALTLSLIHI